MTKAETPRLRIAVAVRRGEMIEFVVDRKLGIDRLAVARGARQQVGQAVIALRPDDEIDRRRAADDFLAFGLRDAAGDRDHDAPAGGGRRVLQAADAAELGIDFLGRLFPDVTGVEDDQIGVVGARGLDIALRRQGVRHTLRVVDVHLAAERLDVELAGSVHAGVVGLSLYNHSQIPVCDGSRQRLSFYRDSRKRKLPSPSAGYWRP